jgi:hypothetical protein
VPKGEKITLLMDNLKIYEVFAFYKTLESVEAKSLLGRFEFVYIPKHVEMELHVLNEKC